MEGDRPPDVALEQLNTLALELARAHPGAAASLREGMEETLTVTRLGITGKLKLTLQSTNPCESTISTVRVILRNVKHWSSGEMCLRWTAAGMLEAESRFRKVEGYRGLASLASRSNTTYSVTVNLTLTHQPRSPQQPPLCNHQHQGTAATQTSTADGQPPWPGSHPRRRPPRCQSGRIARAVELDNMRRPLRDMNGSLTHVCACG